jgi:hypothetical protein
MLYRAKGRETHGCYFFFVFWEVVRMRGFSKRCKFLFGACNSLFTVRGEPKVAQGTCI